MRCLPTCLVVLALFVLAWPLRALDQSVAANYPWATVVLESDTGESIVFAPNAARDNVYYALHSWTNSKKTCQLQELTQPAAGKAKITAHFVIEGAGTKTQVVLLLHVVPKNEAKWIRLDDHLRVRAYASECLVL